ncbi:unnamed protein product [Citrullus colocynthis]|uniref:Uncharacterized protein n=1 Tax=Citrullus colocynthis TaxID=252529 RepID=A0ABP0YZ44_9ROSI
MPLGKSMPRHDVGFRHVVPLSFGGDGILTPRFSYLALLDTSTVQIFPLKTLDGIDSDSDIQMMPPLVALAFSSRKCSRLRGSLASADHVRLTSSQAATLRLLINYKHLK